MSKKSGATLQSWLSGNLDCKERRFLQVGNSLMFSQKFQGLSDGAKFLYLCCAMEAGGKMQFQFPLTSATKYGIAQRTFRRHMQELVDGGFLDVESGATTRQANKYTFSFAWKQANTDTAARVP